MPDKCYNIHSRTAEIDFRLSVFRGLILSLLCLAVLLSPLAQRNGSSDAKKMAEKNVLNGVKPVQGDSTFIGTLHPMLKAAGEEWSTPRLTGTFGHAFSFSMKIGDGTVWQQANIDWWLLWEMIAHIGYEFQEFQVVRNGKQPAPTPKELQSIKDQTYEKVKASIDRGIPAIAWQPMTVEQQNSGVSA